MKEKRNLSKIREQIRKGNPGYVMEGVRICREEQEPEILADLIRALSADPAPSVRQSILAMISDLSRPAAVPVLVRTLRQIPDHPCLQEILSACWQSRLVFHEHLDFLVDLILQGDYMISLESFTIMENAVDHIHPADLKRTLSRLEKALPEMDSDKQKLVKEMMKGLSPFIS